MMAKSSVTKCGPMNAFLGASPRLPGGGSTNALGSNQCSGLCVTMLARLRPGGNAWPLNIDNSFVKPGLIKSNKSINWMAALCLDNIAQFPTFNKFIAVERKAVQHGSTE